MITANHPFSRWNSIFSDSMMTVAVVDRLVHHVLIIEIKAENYRKQAAPEHAKAKLFQSAYSFRVGLEFINPRSNIELNSSLTGLDLI
ncbi:ATP-binding protein (plasmid) [Acaryochloris marina S15]|nr:ATP-binding protein [Acaryochloris marina]QUY45844.1 ATP-binding protein [Acaryochloris marina S15]